MLAVLERLGIFARAPDARPRAEITADIDAELAFHLDASARDLEEAGFAPDAARTEARRRFGDTERVRRECARTQLGERLMIQRLHVVLTGALLVVVALLWFSSLRAQAENAAQRDAYHAMVAQLQAQAEKLAQPSESSPVNAGGPAPAAGHHTAPDGRQMSLESAAEQWEQRFQQSDAWRHGLRVAEQLAALPDTQGPEILERIWHSLVTAHREQAMKPFVFHGGQPFALEVLDLGLNDPDSSVRERAHRYVRTYAWRDLSQGETTVVSWMAQWREKPVQEVVAANAQRWARELGDMVASYESVPSAIAEPLLAIVDDVRLETLTTLGVDLPRMLREAHVCELLPKALGLCDTLTRERADKVVAWCTPR